MGVRAKGRSRWWCWWWRRWRTPRKKYVCWSDTPSTPFMTNLSKIYSYWFFKNWAGSVLLCINSKNCVIFNPVWSSNFDGPKATHTLITLPHVILAVGAGISCSGRAPLLLAMCTSFPECYFVPMLLLSILCALCVDSSVKFYVCSAKCVQPVFNVGWYLIGGTPPL